MAICTRRTSQILNRKALNERESTDVELFSLEEPLNYMLLHNMITHHMAGSVKERDAQKYIALLTHGP